MRSAALLNLPTPTAWWPSEGRRTSIGAAGAPGPRAACVWVAGRGTWESGARAEGGLRPPSPVTTESLSLQCVRG